MGLREGAVLAGAAMTCALVVLWPAPTCAEEISDEDRRPEWGEEGATFDGIAVKAELVADAKVPGGWVLVRTVVNTKDEPASCSVEERVMQQEQQVGARTSGTPFVASATTRRFVLGPHEKRKIGVALPAALGEAITAGERRHAASQSASGAAWEDSARGRAARAVYDRPYLTYFVDYLKPLPPGATAKAPDYVEHPARMPAAPPPAIVAAPDPESGAAGPITWRGGTK